MAKASVILFKPNGKYYTQEEWEIPERVPAEGKGLLVGQTRRVLIPEDMRHSPDFHRIDGGPVLVQEQDPWGYPALLMKYVTEDLDR